ncbi:MAG: NUDIX pyrophosphatase [Anaerolineaceae bacterium]|jgi:dATP pyrophosphohydrolase|nr:NUDIX pyrophosphatase [Anaerolineaceae bacterium]
MTRAPFQILVYPYRKNKNDYEYALLKRADAGFWQGITGGGEDSESPLQAAKRETLEETGIEPSAYFLHLDTIESVPVTAFKDSPLWGENVYVIPQFCFGVEGSDWEIELSQEHSSFGWFLYEQAQQLLKYDGDKTALWELNQRLKGRGPIGGE